MPFLIGKKSKAKLLIEATKLAGKRKKMTNTAGDFGIERLSEINQLLRKKEWLIQSPPNILWDSRLKDYENNTNNN